MTYMPRTWTRAPFSPPEGILVSSSVDIDTINAPSFKESMASTALSGRSILLLEDELIVSLDLEMTLEGSGATVLGPFDKLEDGMNFLENAPGIDAAILDVDLNGKEVFPIAEILQDRGIPFLFHTGHGSREELSRRFDGAPVFIKPVLPERLVTKLAGLLS